MKGESCVKNFQRLFEPGSMGRLEVKNRLVRASMWTAFGALDGSVSQRILTHYRELARGGVGLVNVEFCYVDKGSSKSNVCQLAICDDEYIPGLALLAATIKENGAKAGMQISHAGGQRYVMTPPRKVPSRASCNDSMRDAGSPCAFPNVTKRRPS